MDDPETSSPTERPDPDGAEPEEAAPEEGSNGQALVGTVVAERYRIEKLLGEGAMGAVFLAQHVHMQKSVALKVLHQTMSQNPEVVKRFEREAIAAGRIEHPNVAGATDFGRLKDGAFYLVLEYIAGLSLGDLMEQEGVMDAERACRITAQIASALSAAHGAGIVHRDLKPENVMLPQGDHEGDIVKVLDFGMAKMQEADSSETKLTMHGAVYGTPQYMAPEQAAGQEVDHRADLYAVGLMLYEMLSGKPPFEADQMMALLIKHMTEKVPPLPSTVPRQLSKVVMKLLEKEPKDRFQTADEVIEKLSAFMGVAFQDPRRSMAGISAPMTNTPSPGQVAATVTGQVVDQVHEQVSKVAPLIDKAKDVSQPAVNYLKEPMTVKGKTFPRWVPAAGAFGFVLVLLTLSLSGGDPEAAQAEVEDAVVETKAGKVLQDANPEEKDPNPPDPQLAKVIHAAGVLGSDSALYALEQRNDDERSLTEWMGLAQARLMRKNVEPALEAYKAAIEMDKSMRGDKRMLGALRKLADEEEYAEPILDFAANELGALGADMLFHVWAKTSLKTPSTVIAYDKLTSSSAKKNYSPALKIAMELRDVEECKDYLKLMPEVEKYGDERSMTRLRALSKKRGCGDNKRKDCYPCLRKGSALRDAITQAAMRNAVRFELRNWRWRK